MLNRDVCGNKNPQLSAGGIWSIGDKAYSNTEFRDVVWV
jgi:hypothetical protein